MATIVLKAAEYGHWHRKLAERFRPAAQRGIVSGALRSVQWLVKQTRVAAPANPAGVGSGGAVNTGDFIRRWRMVETRNGARLINDHPAAAVIEWGRRPGSRMPPWRAIMEWARRRLPKFRRLKLTRGRRKAGPLSQAQVRATEQRISDSFAELRSAAFLIARAIARRGLIGRRILTSDYAKAKILEFVRKETIRELQRANRGGS